VQENLGSKQPNFTYLGSLENIIWALWYSIDQEFHVDGENILESQFLSSLLVNGNDPAMTEPKSQISNIEHDGILSIRNLMLIQTQQKTKCIKCKFCMSVLNVVQYIFQTILFSQNLDQGTQRTRLQNAISIRFNRYL
jgi:hypothetical protein